MRRFHVLLALGLIAPAMAQRPPLTEPAPMPVVLPNAQKPSAATLAASALSACGVHWLDGELVAGADTWKARFVGGGVEFTPALPSAPHNMPVTLRTVACGRGAASLPVGAAEPELRGTTVAYQRAEFTETYEVREQGLEQSFTFAELPPGNGDLVVRCALETELQQRMVDGALVLELPGVGSMSVRDVVGIDADGKRCAGSMRLVEGAVELVLPAEAVDAARLPLVLDPLIGLVGNVFVTDDVLDPDVAFDQTAGRYLVVFERVFSTADHDVHGQMVDVFGAPVGARLLIENGTAYEWYGRVANVTSEDTFAVVYTRNSTAGSDVYCRAVRATDSTVGAATVVADTASSLLYPDVGGESTFDDNDAVCAYYDATIDELRAVQLSVIGTGTVPTIVPFGDVVISGAQSTTWFESQPTISKSGGRVGRYLVTWGRSFSSFSGTELRGVVIDRNVGLVNTFIAITNDTSSIDNDLPDNDGDGSNWVVAWERELSPASGDNDIYSVSLRMAPSGSVSVSAPVVIAGGVANQEFSAAVSWIGGSALIGYVDTFSGQDDDVVVRNVDPFTCQACEGNFGINFSFDDDDSVAMASTFSGGVFNSDGAFIAHRQRDISPAPGTGRSGILGVGFDAEDGSGVNFGGGCGVGGTLAGTCSRVGNAGFAFDLSQAAASSATFALFGHTTIRSTCGACTLIPDVFQGTVGVPPPTDGVGRTRFALAIPPDPAVRGFGIYTQFAVAGSSCFGGFDLSNTVFTVVD